MSKMVLIGGKVYRTESVNGQPIGLNVSGSEGDYLGEDYLTYKEALELKKFLEVNFPEGGQYTELEKRALRNFNIHRRVVGGSMAESFDDLTQNQKETWLSFSRNELVFRG